MSKACIDRSDSLIFQHKRRPRVIGFTYASSEVHFRFTESQTFYRSIMTADDRIYCRCASSGMTGQVGGFQNPGVCLESIFLSSFEGRGFHVEGRGYRVEGNFFFFNFYI